jgi:exopolysaccharide production protein ExoQ
MALWILKGSPTSSSKTSIIVLTAGIITFFGLNYFKTKIQKIEMFLIIFLCVFVFLQASIDIIGMIITATGRDSTLTGRIPLWKEVIRMASDHPILGAGYSGFWTPDVREQMWSKFTWMPQSPHNGYIDVYINLGLVGLFLLTGVILSAYRKIKNRLLTDFNLGRFQLSLLLMILLYNIAESSFTKGQSMLWFVFLIIAMGTGKLHFVKRNYGR